MFGHDDDDDVRFISVLLAETVLLAFLVMLLQWKDTDTKQCVPGTLDVLISGLRILYGYSAGGAGAVAAAP